jgi:large subunit ribosomal protein L4
LCAALSRRVEENKLTVFQSLALPEIKTRQVCDLLARFEMSKVLLVTAGADDNLERSARNIPGVTVLQVAGVNVYDVLKHDHLAITVEAAAALVQRLKG